MSEAKKRRLDADLLSEVKDDSTMGTYEVHPFFLSLRKDKEMPKLHSFSCHNIPHLGAWDTLRVLLPPSRRGCLI